MSDNRRSWLAAKRTEQIRASASRCQLSSSQRHRSAGADPSLLSARAPRFCAAASRRDQCGVGAGAGIAAGAASSFI